MLAISMRGTNTSHATHADAVALVRLSRPEKAWPLLRHGPDPRVRSYLIHRLGRLGADAETVLRRLEEEPDVTARRAWQAERVSEG